jgi:hypothetical protein
MLEFNKTVEKFLGLIENSISGRLVKFSINYNKKAIIIVDAPSGFLKVLYSDDKTCAHLGSDGITLTYFV